MLEFSHDFMPVSKRSKLQAVWIYAKAMLVTGLGNE